MSKFSPAFSFLSASLSLALTSHVHAADRLVETWQSGYTGKDATGPQVLGYWQFKPEQPEADSSGRGNVLTFRGASPVAGGKRDGAIESFPGFPVEDKRHAAFAAAQPTLSPKGAFTIEMWIKPKPELAAGLSPVLIDKKYVSDTDYQWRLTPADKNGIRHMQVILGFGGDSETFSSDPFVPGDAWQHVAFTYDGAGRVRFFRNGAPLGGADRLARGPVTPGKQILSIGDRVGSNYAGFPGFIDEVRICDGVLAFCPLALEIQTGRKTWIRMEKAQPVNVIVRNLSRQPMKQVELRVSADGLGEKTLSVPELATGGTRELSFTLDTALRPGIYQVRARVEAPGEMPISTEEFTELTLVPRALPRMPVMMWGLGLPKRFQEELPRLKDLGFTHCLGGAADYGAIWKAGKATAPETPEWVASVKGMLDLALANDIGIAFTLSPGHWLKNRPELQRVGRDGKSYAKQPDVDALLPGLTDFCYNVGASMAQTYQGYPAWQATLINTETRDSSQLSFSEVDRAAYRKASGAEIPEEVKTKSGLDWKTIKDFPADRVIPDADPRLQFLRWFWTEGDGWNALNTAVHRGIHSTGRDDVWTWFDPAIRTPSVPGSGGGVDVLGQWTYTNPDPLRIGYFTDELQAMVANSARPQRVMKMTQLFWYRSQTAPKKAGADHVASPFDDHDPDAAYITISPMHLRESFWTKLARHVDGIMYHGWEALVPNDSIGGYRYTHPDTKEEFRRLHHGVIDKLGPTLLRVGERKADVAYLDSFAAQMFARRGSYGYSGDEAYLTLLHAQLQPEVVYENQILSKGLDGYKLLVLANCDVLTAKVVERIKAFQQRGGIVVGDGNLAPAIKPDIVMTTVARTKRAADDHAAILTSAAQLRSALEGKYVRPADSSNPEIVSRVRTAGAGDYVFAVNDHREFGNYVGQHGMVMENGLPSAGTLSSPRAAGKVYDLVEGVEVPATVRDQRLQWPVNLGPCDGRVFLLLPAALAEVKLSVPETAAQGQAVSLSLRVEDTTGKPAPAVIPVHLEITDPAGRLAEYSGYHAAENGTLNLKLDLARNDTPGVWQIRARELASGKTAAAYLRVTAPAAP